MPEPMILRDREFTWNLEWPDPQQQTILISRELLESFVKDHNDREAVLASYVCEGCGHEYERTHHIVGKRACCPDCSHAPFIAWLSRIGDNDA